jgi:hypothetical protein
MDRFRSGQYQLVLQYSNDVRMMILGGVVVWMSILIFERILKLQIARYRDPDDVRTAIPFGRPSVALNRPTANRVGNRFPPPTKSVPNARHTVHFFGGPPKTIRRLCYAKWYVGN